MKCFCQNSSLDFVAPAPKILGGIEALPGATGFGAGGSEPCLGILRPSINVLLVHGTIVYFSPICVLLCTFLPLGNGFGGLFEQ